MSAIQGVRVCLSSVRSGLPARWMSAKAAGGAEIHPNYFKLKETQKAFQQDNGLLVSTSELII